MYSSKKPSPNFLKLENYYKKIHKEGVDNHDPSIIFNGISTMTFADIIKKIIENNNIKTLLDYGSGKGDRYFFESEFLNKKYPPLKNYWNIQPTLFDPGVPFKKPNNQNFDIVISIDVLEHIPLEDLSWVIEEIFNFAKKIVFLNVACYSSSKTLPNGENAHVSVFPPLWWFGFVSCIANKINKKCFLVCTTSEGTKKKFFNFAINDKFENYV